MTNPDPTATPRHERLAETAQRNEHAILDAFVTAKFEIDESLARLQALSDEHFGRQPDRLSWGDVGTLEHYASLLRRITDSAFGEGEHAT